MNGFHKRIAAALLLFFTSIGAGYVALGHGGMTRLASVAPNVTLDPIKVFGKRTLRVLVVGLDYDYDAKDQQTSRHSRSDVIMAVSLDLTRHRIAELSVPRDMIAVLPDGRRAKINAAQSEGGIVESRRVIADWLGIPGFDRYVLLRIDAAKDLVDALGGIDVDVMNSDALRHVGKNGPVDYDDNWGHLHVHLLPGRRRLNGTQAIGYARFRHDWCSDPCRIMRQQQVIRAVLDRVKNDRLATVEHLPRILDVLHRDVETDISVTEELALATSFQRLSPSDVKTAQVPYLRSIDLPGYGDSLVADDDAKHTLVHAFLEPGPPPTATTGSGGRK